MSWQELPDSLRHVPWLQVTINVSAWLWYWLASKFIGGMIAPTTDFPRTCTLRYRQIFRWLNMFAGNPKRASLWDRGLKDRSVDE